MPKVPKEALVVVFRVYRICTDICIYYIHTLYMSGHWILKMYGVSINFWYPTKLEGENGSLDTKSHYFCRASSDAAD